MNFDGIGPLSEENIAELRERVPQCDVVLVPFDRVIRRKAKVLHIPTPKTYLTPAEREAIAERYANGEDVAKLAREFGVCNDYASAEASRQGLKRRVRCKRIAPKKRTGPRSHGPAKRSQGEPAHKPTFGEGT